MGSSDSQQKKQIINQQLPQNDQQKLPSGRTSNKKKDLKKQKQQSLSNSLYNDLGKKLMDGGILNSQNKNSNKAKSKQFSSKKDSMHPSSLGHYANNPAQQKNVNMYDDAVDSENQDVKNKSIRQIKELRNMREQRKNAQKVSNYVNGQQFGNMQRFPSQGKIALKIKIIRINQTNPQSKRQDYLFQKKCSSHSGVLIWAESNKIQREGANQSLIRFQLIEDDNFVQQFWVEKRSGQLMKGQQCTWSIVNPFASEAIVRAKDNSLKGAKNKNVMKIGPYLCQSKYVQLDSSQIDQFNKENGTGVSPSLKNLKMNIDVTYDLDILQKWGQELPADFQLQGVKQHEKSNKKEQKPIKDYIEYQQANRYFSETDPHQWFAGVFIQQSNMQFNAWVIENADKLNSSSGKGGAKNKNIGNLIQNMSISFHNDVQNREQAFIKSMRQIVKKSYQERF